MSTIEAMKVVQVGPDAVGADMLRDLVARPDIPFELEAIATTDPDLRGKKLGETRLKGPEALDEVPFIGIIDAIENTDAPVVFSNLEPKLVDRYETRLAAGRLVVTSESAGRARPEVPVVNAFVNPGHIDELYVRGSSEGRVIDTGNSLAAIMSVPLAPLHREIGIRSMSVSSLQGWSDAAMHQVPVLVADTRDKGARDIPDPDKPEEVRSDTRHLLGDSIRHPANMHIDHVRLQHGAWIRGHHAKVAVELERPARKKEIEELLRDFQAPEELNASRSQIRSMTKAGGGHRWPGRYHFNPIKLDHGSLLRTDVDPSQLHSVQPMRVQVHIAEFDPDNPTKLVFEVSGDNIIQGMSGGGLLNVMYARAQGYLPA